MTRIEHLRDQAERAERLAKAIVDALTVERLRAFAAECRSQVEAIQIEALQVEALQVEALSVEQEESAAA
jgi:hypothetical protein